MSQHLQRDTRQHAVFYMLYRDGPMTAPEMAEALPAEHTPDTNTQDRVSGTLSDTFRRGYLGHDGKRDGFIVYRLAEKGEAALARLGPPSFAAGERIRVPTGQIDESDDPDDPVWIAPVGGSFEPFIDSIRRAADDPNFEFADGEVSIRRDDVTITVTARRRGA